MISPRFTRTCTRSSQKISEGFIEDQRHFFRACAAGRMRRPTWILRLRPTLCASLCNRNAHGHVTRAVLCENLQVKCHTPDGSRDADPHFLLPNRHAHGHVTGTFLCENGQVECRRPKLGSTLRASLRGQNPHGHLARLS